MSDRTPGPWHMDGPDLTGADDVTIATIMEAIGPEAKAHYIDACDVSAFDGSHPVEEANAKILLAAPDMLEALQWAMNELQESYGAVWEKNHWEQYGPVVFAREAIEKAEAPDLNARVAASVEEHREQIKDEAPNGD